MFSPDPAFSPHVLGDTERLATRRGLKRLDEIGNLCGGCSLTVPTGTPSVGLSLIAPPMDEARLLRIGAAVERALAG